jgi:hypothetical protein
VSKFNSTVTDLIVAAAAPDAEPEGIKAAAGAVCRAIAKADKSDLNAGLARLADSVASADLAGAAVVAICCGAIVENGGDPQAPLGPTLARLEEALTLAQLFAEACEEAAADDEDRDDATGDEDDEEDPVERFGEAVAERMPENAAAFDAVEALGMGAIAMLTRSPAGRKRARREHPGLAVMADDLAPYHERAFHLAKVLNVLDDEPVLVLHPEEKKGYRVRVGGVGTNFELFVLLADALVGDPEQGWLAGEKPDPEVAAACRDQPAEAAGGKSATGAFNFYNWQALRPDGTLPEPGDYSSSKDWIWMEGIPAHVREFEGQRVVLLGPPPYARVIQPGRYFDGMPADVRVEAKLSEAEVAEWLRRIAAAKR